MKYVNRLFWEIWCNGIVRLLPVSASTRCILYKIGGMKVSKAKIKSGCTFDGNKVLIKEGVFINRNVFIDSIENVTIGRNTSIAFDALILTSSHEMGNPEKRAGIPKRMPVEIGEGCWIGARTTVLPGVKIGDGCVIAAGSVVNKNCEPNGVYAGVPARRIKDI